jgi:tRNA threonylcarbamoyladenosine biosynthesis protein TsaB
MAQRLDERLLTLARELGGPLLAIDTSGAATLCRVAWAPGEVIEESFTAEAQQSEAIGSALAKASAEHPDAVKRLKAIVVCLGPGSFTGLRVGLALAKGMAYAGNIPLYGVSSFATLAASQDPGVVALALEARRGEVFAAVYEVGDGGARVLVDDALTTPETLAAIHARFPTARALDDARVKPMRVALSLLLAEERLRRGDTDDVARLVPRYLKVSEAERTR